MVLLNSFDLVVSVKWWVFMKKFKCVFTGIVLTYCIWMLSIYFLENYKDLLKVSQPIQVDAQVSIPIKVESPKNAQAKLIKVDTVLFDVGGLNLDPGMKSSVESKIEAIKEDVTLIPIDQSEPDEVIESQLDGVIESQPVEPEIQEDAQSSIEPEQPNEVEELELVETNPEIDMSDDFLSLCSVIHLEAGVSASLESKIVVGKVVINRLNDVNRWGYTSLNDVIYDDGQFNVTKKASFENLKNEILSGDWSPELQETIVAANTVISDPNAGQVPADVQFFYGDPDKRTWGNHEYCFTVGGNSFFK